MATQGHRGSEAYSAAKAAIMGLTLPMARSVGEHGIRVVSIAPGYFDTPILKGCDDAFMKRLKSEIAIGKVGEPDDLAHFCMSIVENPYINGGTLNIDGGILKGDMV